MNEQPEVILTPSDTEEGISEETKETLKWAEERGLSDKSEQPAQEPSEEPKEETPKEEPKEEPKTEEETPEEEEKKPFRTPKLMPAWKHEVERKKWEQEKADLEAKLKETKVEPPLQTVPSVDVSDKIKAVAQKHGLDEEVLADIASLVAPKPNEMSDEIKSALKEINEFKKLQAIQAEELGFKKEFNSVLPFIKQEYPNATEEQLSQIETNLKNLAFTEQFKATPLDVIYKGVDDFRPKTVKRTAEPSRQRPNVNVEEDLGDISEEDLLKLPRDKQAKYFERIEKQGR